MKILKCPLCGKDLIVIANSDFVGFTTANNSHPIFSHKYNYACRICEYNTNAYISPEDAYKAALRFISQFPPIMRVHPGDNLKLKFRDDILIVMDKDIIQGRFYLKNCCGDKELAWPFEVDKWPWELEQEGDQK